MTRPIWLLAGVRTPFTRVDGGLAKRDAIALGVPVLRAMAERLNPGARIDAAIWGSVIPNLAYSNLARETWLDAQLDPTVPTSAVIMQCATSMMAAFDLAGVIGRGGGELGLAGGAESMSHIQTGLSQPLSDGCVKRSRPAAGSGGSMPSANSPVTPSGCKCNRSRIAAPARAWASIRS